VATVDALTAVKSGVIFGTDLDDFGTDLADAAQTVVVFNDLCKFASELPGQRKFARTRGFAT
jgi:hypothetical protein